jgi:hypothetical protein
MRCFIVRLLRRINTGFFVKGLEYAETRWYWHARPYILNLYARLTRRWLKICAYRVGDTPHVDLCLFVFWSGVFIFCAYFNLGGLALSFQGDPIFRALYCLVLSDGGCSETGFLLLLSVIVYGAWVLLMCIAFPYPGLLTPRQWRRYFIRGVIAGCFFCSTSWPVIRYFKTKAIKAAARHRYHTLYRYFNINRCQTRALRYTWEKADTYAPDDWLMCRYRSICMHHETKFTVVHTDEFYRWRYCPRFKTKIRTKVWQNDKFK